MVPVFAKIKQYMSANHLRTTEMFRLFDKDGSGSISMSELHATLTTKLGIDLDEDEVAMIIRDIDRDGDTEVSYKEFCKKVNSGHFAPVPKRRRHSVPVKRVTNQSHPTTFWFWLFVFFYRFWFLRGCSIRV